MASHRSVVDLKPDEAPEAYWQPVYWKPFYTYICNLYAVLNLSVPEIALQTGIGKSRVYAILTDPRGKAEIQKAVDKVCESLVDITHQFKAYSPEALAELVREMRVGAKGDEVKQRASLAILDRAGYTPIQKHLNISTTIEADVAERLEAAMRDFAVIDAEYEVLDDTDESALGDLDDLERAEVTEDEYHRRVASLRDEASSA